MFIVGLSFLVYWLLVGVFFVEAVKAALIVALVFIILGVLIGERPWETWTKRP